MWHNVAYKALLLSLCASLPAHATLKVDSPNIEQGIIEIETKNRFDFDHRSSEDRFRQHVIGVGYGFTDWWAMELEGEWEKQAGSGYSYNATEVESKFMFTEQGEFWVDAGAKFAYELLHESGGADEIKAELMLEKDFGQFVHTANVTVEKQVGNYRQESTGMNAAWRSRYLYNKRFNPGIEYYGDWGEIKETGNFDHQKHRIGPAISGRITNGVKYDIGWIFGLSEAAEDHVLKVNLEYEFPY